MKIFDAIAGAANQNFFYNTTRRRFLQGMLGLGAAATVVPNLLPSSAVAASRSNEVPPHVLQFTTSDGEDSGHKMVVIYMQGGLSNFDTFDPKTHSTIVGPFKKIPTASKNVFLTDILQPLARHTNNFVVINNLRSEQGEHDGAAAKLLTTSPRYIGSSFLAPTVYTNPFIELANLLNNQASGEVGYVVLHQNTIDRHGYNRTWRTPWGGIKHEDPVTVYAPYDSTTGRFTNPFGEGTNVPISRYRGRVGLLEAFDNTGHTLVGDLVERHNRAYRQARSLLDGEFSQTFDLSRVPVQILEKYGDSKVGKQLLLARRMLQSGARVVVANDGNYDCHWGVKEDYGTMLPLFARALSALLDDIQLMDERVYVVILTEFGRDPKLNSGGPEFIDGRRVYQPPGRHHWSCAFSMAIISNDRESIGGGRTIGVTNNDGQIVGDAFDSYMVGETLMELLGLGRFEKRGDFVTNDRFPYIDIKNERVVGSL